jgi:hypothetical protein
MDSPGGALLSRAATPVTGGTPQLLSKPTGGAPRPGPSGGPVPGAFTYSLRSLYSSESSFCDSDSIQATEAFQPP